MGVWNETCGITQMPICGGDKVRMFLIVKDRYSDDSYDVCHSYTTDLWKPYGIPLKGTYDEYGRIENIENDVISNFLLDSIREMIIEVPNRMGEVFKREELDWATVIDFLTDEGLKVANPFDVANITKRLDEILAKVKALVPNLPENGWSSERSDMAKEQKEMVASSHAITTMYHMMVHEDVYQALAKTYKAPAERFSSWTDGDMRKTLEQDAQRYLARVRETIAEESKFSKEELSSFKFRVALNRDDFDNRFVRATNHLTGNYGSGTYLRKYLDFVEKKIREGASDDDPEIKILTDQFIDFVCFNQCMTLLRKMWMPQCGKGGQDREFILHKFLGETITSFSAKKMKEWDEEHGDIDDSEEDDLEEGVEEPNSE